MNPNIERLKLIFIGAHKSGNPRSVFDRMRLAIDANYNARQIANIDPARVYVSGLSGGARVAMGLALGSPQIIAGVVASSAGAPVAAPAAAPAKK